MENQKPTTEAPSVEDWLWASEARYDSMKNLLQSVKKDIDQLTSRIDSTQMPLSPDVHASTVQSSKWITNLDKEDCTGVKFCDFLSRYDNRPDILENLNADFDEPLNEVVEDEYKDIQIRGPMQPFCNSETNRELFDCVTSGVENNVGSSVDGNGGKTWRSPSDYNLHDPFKEEENGEFERGINPFSLDSHFHQSFKQTDLDELGTGASEPDDESGESMSPAVSPTFDNFATGEVNLNDIVLASEERSQFDFSNDDRLQILGDTEVCGVYDKAHALTTISEASEEIEDDWSSSDMDSSARGSDPQMPGESVTSVQHVPPMSTKHPNGQSMEAEFKSPRDISPDRHSVSPCEYRTSGIELGSAENQTPKPVMDVNQTFVFDPTALSMPGACFELPQVVKIRPKKFDSESSSPKKQRPVSAGSLKLHIRSGDSTVLGSVYSVLSTFSQESIISEADSYVTVNSRLLHTGSEELYTTACSDSEIPVKIAAENDFHSEFDECPTLSRKRTMLPRNQRHRSNVPRPMNGDYSSEDEMDDTVFTSSEAITVTPKFSRLPSKIPSPKDSISIKLMNADPDNQNKNTELVPHAQTKNDPSHVLLRRSDCISSILIQRPTKRSLDGSDSDVGNESDGSSSLEELDNDVSRSTSWSINDQGSQELKPLSPLACNRSCRSDFEQPAAKKEPSKLSEPSGNSAHSNHGSDIDDDSSVKERFIEKHIPVPNSGKLNGLPSLDASSSFVSGLIFRDCFHPPVSNELLTQGEMSLASRKVNETQLAEPNQPVTPAMDNTATVDSSTVIGQLKANISNSVTGPTSEAEKTHVTVAAPGNTIETRASTLLLQPGSITTPLASTTETAVVGCAMLGSSVTFYERPEYLDAQKRRTSHNTSDRCRQYNTTDRSENHLEKSTESYQFLSTEHKERDALPLAAVLASAEAIAARPSLYAAPRDKEVQNRLGAPDSSDLYPNINDPAVRNDLRHGWQMNTSISSAANSTQPVMNSSNETNGFAPPTIIRIDNIINHEQKVFQQPPSERVQRSSPRECFYDRSKDQLEWSHRSQQTSDVGQPRDRDRFNPNPDRVVLVPSAYPQNDMHPMEDIQLASQRKSRILYGDAGYFDTSVKLISSPQTPLPQNAEVSYVRDNYDGESPLLPSFRKTSEIGSVPESQHQKFFGDVNYVDHTHYDKSEKGGGLSFGSSNAPPSVPVKKSHIRLMNAPQTTTPIQTEINEQISSSTPRIPSKQYGSRFSPPMIRPKWQLKPIPSDAEIRERLRSRSRQRAEERQSRVVQTEATSATRQRDSRSDSRYRFTDLDSAIAESRGETTVPKRWPQSGVELDSQVKKLAPSLQLENRITTTSCSTQRPPPSYSGIHAIASLNTSTRRFFGDAKSYSSLLETDIDTGENYERPILLETDVDNMVTGFKNPSLHSPLIGEFADQKTRSLFNLTLAHTPGSTYRGVYPNDRRPDLASTEPEQNWQRTKSLQGLPHREQESSKSYYRTFSQQSKLTGVGAKGLLERLRDRAKSDHELRIAQSLTKLHVPEWLDKAECLTRSSVQSGDGIVDSVVVQKCISSDLDRRVPAKGPLMEHSRPLLSSIRSSPSSRHPEKAVSTGDATNEASRSKLIGGYQPKFIRPSQELRERGSSISRLRPITSKLHNSMQTLLRNLPNDEIRPQAAPRATRQTGQSTEMKLSPQDFVPKREQIWGHEIPTLNLQQARDRQFPVNERIQNPSKLGDRCQMISEAYENVRGEGRKSYLAAGAPNTAYSGQVTQVMQPISGRQQANVRTMYEDIKPADYDSGTEHSGEHSDERPHCSSVIITQNGTSSNATQNPITQAEFTSATQSNYQKTEHHLAQNSDTQRSEWNSIDADGETESEVTDGLDQISDLTCLTSLVDTFASRHRALLANRPTALDHLLTGLGWWPSTPQPHHHHSPPTAAEAISIAAHEFDVDEDSHRSEFIDLLAGPESRRPINLGEFALNQLTDSVKRKKEDGLLYISCGRSECTKPSVKVANAANWCACANCYTLYCSTACRSIDRQSAHDHPTVCSFARARRVCTRILRSFAPGQLNGLTALAKTGMARLGRGGILLPFALVRHAELFLERSKAICSANEGSIDNSLEYAYSCWENHHLPSPGGLMSPPIYLTISELEELDSTVANPCRRYAPSSSMVLLVVVCAYELIARSDGRPVHLFKQSLVVPFPAHQTSGRSGQKQAATETQPVTPTRVTSKPSLPQTNGMVNKPDRQAIAAREAYMIRLQRMLRERGVSLRHHYPEIYTHIANFVENGVTFTPIRILFHDFVLREEVICTIKPMSDPHIQPTRELQSQRSKHDVDVYEDVAQDGKGTEPVDNKKRHRTNHPESISRQGVRHSQPETDF